MSRRKDTTLALTTLVAVLSIALLAELMILATVQGPVAAAVAVALMLVGWKMGFVVKLLNRGERNE